MKKIKEVEIFTDGASWGNPGKAGIGVVVCEDKRVIEKFGKYIGETTNNVAEYIALLYGLKAALNLGAEIVKVNLDSELLTKQIQGEYRVKEPRLRTFFEQITSIWRKFKKIEVKNIQREKNKEADKLANQAIKEAIKKNLPPEELFVYREKELF